MTGLVTLFVCIWKTFRWSQAIPRESAGNSDPGTCWFDVAHLIYLYAVVCCSLLRSRGRQFEFGKKMESCKNGAELIDVNWGSSSSLVGMEKQQHFALCTLAESLRVNQKHRISTALSCPCLDWTNYCMLDIHDIVCAQGIWLCSVAIIYMRLIKGIVNM